MGKEKYSLDNYPVAEDKYNLDNYQLVDTVGEAKIYQKKNGTSNGTNGSPVPTSPSTPLSGSEENINTPPQVVPEVPEPPTAEQIMQAKGKEIISRQTDLTNSINEYNRRFGTDISQDILNDPDKTGNFLTQFTRTVPKEQARKNDRLQYLTENPNALNIQIINGKGVNVGTAAEKNQMLAELGDENSLFNKAQQYKKQLVDKTIDLSIAKGKQKGDSRNRIVNDVFKRLDPEGYKNYHETIAARTGEQGDSNDEKLWKGASDQVDILNTVKAPFEKLVNDRLQNTANDMMVVGTLTGNDELVQNAKAYQLEVKSEDDLDREYPVLAKHRLAAAISDEIRTGNGIVGTVGLENLTLLGNAFSSRTDILKTDAFKAALADPLQRDNAIDLMLHPDLIASSSVLGSALNNFYKPFKDIVHSVGDMTTIRDRMDRQTDITKDQLFPEENPNVNDFIHGARVVANTSSMLGGYIAAGAIGGEAGAALSLGARGTRLAHSALSFGIGAYDQNMSDADSFMGKDETAKKVIYSTIGMIINTVGGELLSLPTLSKMPALQKPILEMTNKIADGTITKDLMAELLNKAKPHFMDYAEKYSINLGKNVLVMKYFGVANALDKMAFGGASGDDVVKEATTGLVETALGVSLLSGFGAVGDVKKGRANSLKSTIYRLASQPTEAKDIITTAYKEGRYSEAEYNQKMQILNTAIVAKQNLDLWQTDKDVTLSIPQKAVFVSNKVAEEVIKKKLENPGISEGDKKDLTYQLETLATQRADIQNGLNFDSNLSPLTKIYEAENAFLKAKQAFSDGEGTEAALIEAKQNFVKAQREQSRVQVDKALTTEGKEIVIPRPLELPQAVGKDITYNGEVGVLKQSETGEYVFDDGSGKREVIIPVADKTNPTETLAQLGITVLPEVSPADVKVAQKDREQVGFVKSKNGNEFFISLANPSVENTVGDQVFIKGKNGKLKEVSGMTDDVKLSLVNKFLQEKGLPPREALIKIEPLKTTEQKTTITNESINNQVSQAAESGSEIPADQGQTAPVPEAAKTAPAKVSEPTVKSEDLKEGDKLQWDVYGNEETGEWTIGKKVKTRGGQDAVVLSKIYVESSKDGTTYNKEYADKNGIKYHNEHTVEHIVPIDEFQSKSENKPKQNEPVVKPLTADAEQLLAGLTETSKPAFVTKNLERIAKENDIEVTDKSTPDDIINALKEKQNAIQKQSPTEGVLRNEGVQREGELPGVVTKDKSKKPAPKSKVQQKSKVNEKATKPATEKSKAAKEPAKTGETKKAADEKFNKKVDEYAASFKAKFIRPVDPNIKKSGAPFSDSDVVDFAVNIIKRAHSVGGDIAIAIDKAVQYIKDKWNDKWGTFDEKMARRHFRNIAIEEKFAAELENNYEHYKQRYLDEYGRMLNADNAKEFSEDYRANRNYLANAVHIPSREFMKKLYAELVKAPPPPGKSNLVTINSGGTGAGKSSSTSLENEAKLNYDGTMANMNGDRLIQQALEAGNKVLVNYTFSEPLKALQNAIGRAKETSRIVELAPHINSHIGSFETIKKLHEKYKDNPNVKIFFTDNRGAKGTAKAMTFGELEKIQYLSKEQINKQLNDYIDQQYKEGNLIQSEYEGFKGNEFASYRGTVPEGNNRIAEQAGRTGSAAYNAGTAEPTGRKDNTGLHGDRANESAGTTETNGSVKSKATQQFFSDVISGEEKFKPTAPWQPEISIDDIPQKVKDTYDGFNDNFDAHIVASIPVFKETEYKKVNAIANTLKEGSVLDIGGSEGSFVKSVTTLSSGKIHTVNLDVNHEMKVAFEKRPVDNSQYIQQSFSAPYKESDGEYPQYKPADKFDVVHEAYTIQFFQDKDRHFYVKEIKDNLLKPDGVVFLQQKVMTSGYLENETKKDKEFKSKYFSQKDIAAKAETTLAQMQVGQSSEVELVSALSDNFKNVYQFYDAGNFKGYLASDSKAAAEKYLAAIGDTNSKFTTRDQLLKIEDSKVIQGDISSLTETKEDAVSKNKTISFNSKVDNVARAIKNTLTPEHLRDPNIHKGAFIDLDTLIDKAAEFIKKAHEVGGDLKQAVEKAVKHLKTHWRKGEWGDFDEQAVRDHFSGIGDEAAGGGRGGNAITHAATSEARKNLGQKPYEKVIIGDKQLNAEADAALAKGYDVEKLLTRLEQDRLTGEGGGVTSLETAIMKKYKAVLDEEAIKNPTNENLAKSFRLFQASDVARSDVGRTLRQGQDVIGVDVGNQNLADFYNREMDAHKVTALSEKEKTDVEKRYNDLKDAHDKLVKKLADQKAMDSVKRLKKTAPKVKKTHDDYVKERNDIREQIKAEKERHAKQMENIQTKGVSFSLTPKMVRLIGKLVKSHVEEGTSKLADVVDSVFDNVKDLFDGITKGDVTDIMGGAYSTPQPRSDVAKQIADLRTQIQLTKKLQNLYDGADTPAKRERLPRSQEVQDLQKKIKEYIKSQKTEPTQEQLDASKLKALKTKYTNEITKLKERLRTGKLPPERSEPVRLDREGKDLKDRYIHLKQQEELRLAKIEYAQRTKIEKLRNNVFELLNAPRTIEASLDFSAVLRQAIIPTVSHPVLASKAAVEMFAQSVSQKRFDRWLFDLKESPAYETMEKSGLYIADPHNIKLSAKEEAFMNNMVEKIPIFGTWLVKGSERAYISYLNKMRADLFRQGADVLIGKGYSFENAPEQYKALASWVNNATGRGGIGEGLNKNSPILNAAFFSPRLIASRLNLLGFSDLVTGGNGFYGKLTPEVRKMAWKDMAKFIGFGTSVLLMAWLNRDKRNEGGLSVEVDPRSPDFGKIKYGDTRWDIWGGFQQYVRFASQMIAGLAGLPAVKSASTGRLAKLNTGKFNSPTYASLGLSFLRGKASPVPSLVWDFAAGENVVGEKIVYNWGLSHRNKEITLTDIALSKFLPLITGDIVDAYKSGGMKSALMAGVPAIFGVGVQTYNNTKSTAVSVNIKTPFGTIK